MTRLYCLLWLAACMAIALTLWIQASRAAIARGQLVSVSGAYEQTRRDVQEIFALRNRQQTVSAAKAPPQDVIAQVNTVLSEIGVPTNRLKSLNPESDTAISSAAGQGDQTKQPLYKRQTLRLALENLAPAEIGAFLLRWRAAQSVWTPIRIELAHNRTAGTQNQFDAAIVLSAVYIAHP